MAKTTYFKNTVFKILNGLRIEWVVGVCIFYKTWRQKSYLMLQIYRLLESTCTVLCGWLVSSTVQLTNFRSNRNKTVFRNKNRTVSFYLYYTTIEYRILYSCWKNEFLEHFLGFSVFSSRISGIQCLKHHHCIAC